LITVATGTLSEAVADRTGLVSAHAYAVLSIREIKVEHMCMLLILVDAITLSELTIKYLNALGVYLLWRHLWQAGWSNLTC